MVDDIYDIWEVSWWQTPWFLLMVTGLLCLFGVVFMLRYRRRYSSSLILPEELAYRQLQLLLADKEALQKEFYHLITRIVKYRLAAYSQEDFEYCTDEELCSYIEQRYSALPVAHELITTIRRSSLVKFAGEKVSNEDCVRDGVLIERLRKDPLDTSGTLRDTNNT